MQIVVGISAGRKYDNYLRWIIGSDNIKVIRLGYDENNIGMISQCHAIVLSGGEDVHPRFYNKPEFVKEFNLEDVDEARDEFEWKILDHVQKESLPLLGICRGLQLTNVYFGGTLVGDIVSTGKPDHTKFEPSLDRYHKVKISDYSFLKEIAGVDSGEVNSAHHQSADVVGNGLVVNALSEDDVIEGLELKDRKNKPFFLLVQWHPERMADRNSPLTKNIREKFLASIKAG
ncbi:MAG TPA: gamma-glutamyl-gamma-aminobutyrate hydrolase family protein [Cyclobacteriaceae bacterium]|nr:gamma-glutamyl-gamma-aminobutyrate hydrolase family protein [Cyclobacteriaceae bacterium]